MTLPVSCESRDDNGAKEVLGQLTCIQLSKSQESCRSESQTSSQNSSLEICRICHCEGDSECGLIAPCYCAGSLRYVHQSCLQQWIKSSNIRCCELCKFQFIMQTKTKPFMEWEPLEMTGFERRKLLCAVMFHAIALTCVVWSLYVLIHRTAEEIQYGLLEWPFWTKLIVVAIGFTGGVVFMYIQCKAYMQICQRWKAFNRVIYVQNAPEKQVAPPSPVLPYVYASGPPMPLECGPSLYSSDFPVRQYSDSCDETSIDLKGVRNLHIFFNDESSSRVRVQNENEDGGGSLDAVAVAPGNSQRNDDNSSTSWHIKIGKSESVNPPRCSETDGKTTTTAELADPLNKSTRAVDDPATAKSSDATSSSANKNDSVLKLQIKKSEIVIKFGQKNGEPSAESSDPADRKDTSVNIKIDDQENDPIVIDVVKKAQAEVVNDPVQIRFDFGQSDEDGGSSSKLMPSTYCDNSNSETDSGSHSPLLVGKSYGGPSDSS